MMRPPRPPAPLGASSKSNNPFQNVLDGDDVGTAKKTFVDNESSDDDDDDSVTSEYSTAADDDGNRSRRQRPPRPSILPRKALTASAKRRRRRSSARFLQLGGGRPSSIDPSQQPHKQQADSNLSELYQKAIRMNAENKINAGNSWNLQLIENIDKFLEMDEEEEEATEEEFVSTPTNAPANDGESSSPPAVRATTTTKKRVNFTKASCTLDASVKIYSYRVDDVHLTSYKVLANLNRTDNKKKTKDNTASGSENADDEQEEGSGATSTKRSSANKPGSTLETHVANINLNKLDSAFDIDPLFHKMSKSFDEGGAKGLLLVNLAVGANGCNIIFDSSQESKEEDADDATATTVDNIQGDESNTEQADKKEGQARLAEGMMDITSLTQKLESLLQDNHEDYSIQELPLVPQLAGLRAEHEGLDSEGFVDDNAVQISSAFPVGPKTPGRRRYHADDDEEREADKSIHKEAMERSRLSAGQNLSLRFMSDSPMVNNDDDDDDDNDGFVDFGGAFGDGDDDDGDFDNFIAMDEHGARYSDISFSGGSSMANNDQRSSETTTLLDAIATGQTVLAESDYSYFTAPTLNSNLWAGAAHWKRTALKKKKKNETTKSKKTTKKTPAKRTKKALKERSMVNFDAAPNLDSLFVKSKRKVSTQLSKAMVTKYTNQENVLPEDAGFQVEQLTKLFLRPNTILKTTVDVEPTENTTSSAGNGKTVGFQLPNWDDGSFGGGDDDGAGFDFGGGDDDNESVDDEFLVQELEGVRKVEKVQVGYATVAKKVDVKRLKRDLWAELEQHFANKHDDDDDMKYVDSTDSENKQDDATAEKFVSFQDAVNEMESQKAQMDATLPFYFICILHLANEKGLRLESQGLEDFTIHDDGGTSVGMQSSL